MNEDDFIGELVEIIEFDRWMGKLVGCVQLSSMQARTLLEYF
jgi:hypothetical protein